MVVRPSSTLASSLASIADTLARAKRYDAQTSAILLLGTHPLLEVDAPSQARATEAQALQSAIQDLVAVLSADGAEALLRLRPVEAYEAEALRAGHDRVDKLARLRDPLTPGGTLCPAEWSLLGAATRLHTEESLGALYLAIARQPELFSNVRDAQALFRETCDMDAGIRIRGPRDPINQWLPAMRDTHGHVHDVLDVATGMVNAQAYFIPAAIFAKKAVLAQTSAACLALQSARSHDVCEEVFANDRKLFRGHLRSAHVRLIVGQSLGLGASDCLSQTAWQLRGTASPRSFGDGLPNILATALTGTMFTFTDAEMAAALKRMHAHGHDVCGRSGTNQALPLHDLVIMGMPMSVKVLVDLGADASATFNDLTPRQMLREEWREAQALRVVLAAAEARQAAQVERPDNSLRAMAMP